MKASHILVKNLYEAQDIEKSLSQGKSFESLARKFSICASAELGGWLGDLSKHSVDPEFKKALLLLQINEVSKPVKTKFGYHLIRREPEEEE
jgi:parvulin-like peptidyl-prolyl isomerase